MAHFKKVETSYVQIIDFVPDAAYMLGFRTRFVRGFVQL